MKKSLVALAALAAVGAASAQSSVTLYGVVDVNVQSAKGSTTLTSMESGGLNGSRWGLRGEEDLGGGLKGIFRLESGFNTDSGTSAQGGRLFGRHSTVGLAGGFGSVRIGRTLTPLGALTDEYATLGTKGADLSSVAGTLGNTFYRTDNAITYDTPNMGGLTAQVQYSLAQESIGTGFGEQRTRAGRNYGFHVLYKGGPLQAGLGYLNIDTAVAPVAPAVIATRGARNKGVQMMLGFNFGFATVKGMFERDDRQTAEDPTFLGLEASMPFGAFTVSAGIGRMKDQTGLAATNDDVDLWTVQGVYNLSKRTALYSFYTSVENDRQSARGFRAPAAGQDSRLFQIGVRHSF